MASIKLIIKPSCTDMNDGGLYYRLLHQRTVRVVATGLHIPMSQWDVGMSQIRTSTLSENPRLNFVAYRIRWEMQQVCKWMAEREWGGSVFTMEELVDIVTATRGRFISVFDYFQKLIDTLNGNGRFSTSNNCRATFHSLLHFRSEQDLAFTQIDCAWIEAYECYLKGRGLKRNTTSFYLRTLRMVYNKAMDDGLVEQNNPFKRVYTGIDRTIKRAIGIEDLKRIKNLDLNNNPKLEFARDMFLMSFYLRGMSFVDMAYLKKTDLKLGILTYTRRKTGQTLQIQWEAPMEHLILKYRNQQSPYLLPILTGDGRERSQYLKQLSSVNYALKIIGKRLGITLTTYVARHSWASVAYAKNITISVIREGMGHDSEKTTQIYLASIQTYAINRANRKIMSIF